MSDLQTQEGFHRRRISMLHAVRKQLTYANIAATLAVLFAMSGGAYALSGTGSGAGSRGGGSSAAGAAGHGAVATIAKKKSKPKGSAGKRGPRGPEGKQGPAGPEGKQGPEGKAGAGGKDGASGTNGASATTESFSGRAHGCEEGGVAVKSASPEAIVCNGKAGADGTTGFTETLPAGKTETGSWSAAIPSVEGEVKALLPLTFAIPLAPPARPEPVIGEADVHYFAEGESATPGDGCDSGTAEKPEAEPGNLCIYTSYLNGWTPGEVEVYDPGSALNKRQNGVGVSGATLKLVSPESSGWYAAEGTWAVAAPVAP